MIKKYLLSFCMLSMAIPIYAQKLNEGYYLGEKGFLPGSYSIIIEVSNDTLHYETYNHFYYQSYKRIKNGFINLNKNLTNKSNSIRILIKDDKLKFEDYQHNIKKKVKYTTDSLRIYSIKNIAYCYSLTSKDSTIHYWELFKGPHRKHTFIKPGIFKLHADSVYNLLQQQSASAPALK